MSRTARYKLGYFCYMAVAAGLTLSLMYFAAGDWRMIAVFVVLLLLPGRLLGYFWRDLLRGLRLLQRKQYEQSAVHSSAFIEQVRAKPWLKKMVWLGTCSYSRDPESLALNNLGLQKFD
jgi:hypothetical protein